MDSNEKWKQFKFSGWSLLYVILLSSIFGYFYENVKNNETCPNDKVEIGIWANIIWSFSFFFCMITAFADEKPGLSEKYSPDEPKWLIGYVMFGSASMVVYVLQFLICMVIIFQFPCLENVCIVLILEVVMYTVIVMIVTKCNNHSNRVHPIVVRINPIPPPVINTINAQSTYDI